MKKFKKRKGEFTCYVFESGFFWKVVVLGSGYFESYKFSKLEDSFKKAEEILERLNDPIYGALKLTSVLKKIEKNKEFLKKIKKNLTLF